MTLPKSTENVMTSEIRYRRLFESARDGILILDAVTRRITDVNPFMMELLGYSLDEFLGKELWEIGRGHHFAVIHTGVTNCANKCVLAICPGFLV